MTVALVDTHTHLDDEAFDDDRNDVIASSRKSGVTRWINVGYCPERWATTLALARSTQGMDFMLGMHPGHTDHWSEETAHHLEELISSTSPVAIGEIGLDLHWRQDNLGAQFESFARQLAMAETARLPAVIHMRSADTELLDVLTRSVSLPHIHFHSFDGGDRLRRWALEHGSTFGVGGLMTRMDSESLRSWIQQIPKHRVVLETDSPYLKPHGIRGKRNQPANITRITTVLAGLWELSLDEVGRITTENAYRIFGLDTRDDR